MGVGRVGLLRMTRQSLASKSSAFLPSRPPSTTAPHHSRSPRTAAECAVGYSIGAPKPCRGLRSSTPTIVFVAKESARFEVFFLSRIPASVGAANHNSLLKSRTRKVSARSSLSANVIFLCCPPADLVSISSVSLASTFLMRTSQISIPPFSF